MKQWLKASGFLFVSVGITWLLNWYMKQIAMTNALAQLAIDLTAYSQIKQIVASISLYMIGYIFLCVLQLPIGEAWNCVLAFPIGILCWCLISCFVVVTGIPYQLLMMVLIVFFLLLASGVLILKFHIAIAWKQMTQSSFYFAGITLIVSSGLLSILLSHDSVYFIMKYGQILAIEEGLTENVKTFIWWTGLTPAFLGSLAEMLGIDNIYTIHHMVMISFIGIFYLSILELFRSVNTVKKARFRAVGITLFLVLIPAFILLTKFILSNAYFMVYLYMIVIFVYKMEDMNIPDKKRMLFLLSILIIMLTLCRAEAFVCICFVLICFSTLDITNKDLILWMAIPAGFWQIAFWVKAHMVTKISYSGYVNVKTVFVMVGVYVGTLFYLAVLRSWVKKTFQGKLPGVIVLGLCFFNFMLCILNLDRAKINLDVIFYNLANTFWGIFPLLALLFCIFLIYSSKKLKSYHLIWVGYILFNFAICMCRANELRKGYGDSYNRILCGMIPLFLWAIVKHYTDYVGRIDE